MPRRPFRIFGICLVKNEADMLALTLRRAAEWADRIFVYDNGSTDGTWELAQSLASEVIVPWKQTDAPFQDGLRSDVFHAFQHEARPDDWWCRLDADEIYIDRPREFLARIPRPYHVVWGLPITYYLTQDDLERVDFSQPIETRLAELRHYRVPSSEIRFLRHRTGLNWTGEMSWPRHAGPVWPERIRFRHYQYRSPAQLEQRVRDRLGAMAHLPEDYWWNAYRRGVAALIARKEECQFDDGSGEFQYDEAALPRLRPSRPRFWAQYVLHTLRLWK